MVHHSLTTMQRIPRPNPHNKIIPTRPICVSCAKQIISVLLANRPMVCSVGTIPTRARQEQGRGLLIPCRGRKLFCLQIR